jgi:secreted PhoX family phosphatase
MKTSRRDFLSFMAAAGAVSLLPSCATSPKAPPPFVGLKPTTEDLLKLAPGFEWRPLLRWRDELTAKGARFGFNNDYLAYIPLTPANPLEGLIWVNHEYSDPYYNSGWRPGQPRTLEQIEIERREVGGSIVHIKSENGVWSYVKNSKYNRRLERKRPSALLPAARGESLPGERCFRAKKTTITS